MFDRIRERVRQRRRFLQSAIAPATTTPTRELEEAEKHLRTYADTTNCLWCKRKGGEIANLTAQLKNVTPMAEEFNKAVGNLEASKMQKLGEEIFSMQQKVPSPRVFKVGDFVWYKNMKWRVAEVRQSVTGHVAYRLEAVGHALVGKPLWVYDYEIELVEVGSKR